MPPTNLPTLDSFPINRIYEKHIAEHFLSWSGHQYTEVRCGNDMRGVPDVFVFKEDNLTACIEIGGYTFGSIEDLQPSRWENGMLIIDVGTCSAVHDSQTPPYTIVEKKIKGLTQYERFRAEDLLLVIHSEVKVSDDGTGLRFAMDGPMQMSPSCNNFSHNREEIIAGLQQLVGGVSEIQWDGIWLVDYTANLSPYNCPWHELYS